MLFRSPICAEADLDTVEFLDFWLQDRFDERDFQMRARLHGIEVGFRTDRQGRQQMLAQEALMLTGDMNILAVQFIVQYKIKESSNYLFNVSDVNETIGKAAEASMREVVGKGKIDEALTTGKAQIQQDTQILLQSILDQYQGGVQVAAIQLQDVSPPEAVAAAFKEIGRAHV